MTIDCTKTTNPAYWVLIKSNANGRPFEVLLDMPEQISTSASSEWESRLPYNLFQNLLSELPLGGLISQGAYAAGLNNIYQDLSYQMWTDSSPIEINMSLLLDAEDNAYKDVWVPLMILSGAVLPIGGDANNTGSGGGLLGMLDRNLLRPPGPLNGDPNSEGAVHLHIGKQMYFLDCIMTTGTPQWDSRLASDGYPIAGQLDVTFRTSKIYGRNDWMIATGIGNVR